ncbi:MAG: glycosyltransferase family 39 protein [Actinobacteria bacterium]|nr:glycosyltransferase family 39 protein [Actinomycetota bacterium]
MTAPAWIRALPGRYGRRTLVALALIAVLGLGLRAYAVVHPVANPADDSHAYYGLAAALYEEGSYGNSEFHDSSDWSPGAPLLYAVSFYLTGGAREGTARIVEALLGVAAILVVFALAERLGGRRSRRGRWTGLLAAFGMAVYPAFIHSTGELMSEPPAILTLPAAILAFLWAGEKERWWAWLVPGLLFGLTAMFRPEYLFVAAVFVVLAAIRIWPGRGPRPALAGAGAVLLAVLVAIVPWTVRNLIVLERLVPISTGSGKALYVGTFYPADGEYQKVKATLYHRFTGRTLSPYSEALNNVDPTPLFNRVAREYNEAREARGEPPLSRDAALGKIGKENFSKYFGEDPLAYLGMTARKIGRIWSSGVGEAMSSTPGRIVQLLLVFGGLAGFVLLGVRRRWWELVALATPIVIVTAVGAISLAAPRRNEVLMTLVFPLAAVALSSAASALSSRREWSRPQSPSPASSQPS